MGLIKRKIYFFKMDAGENDGKPVIVNVKPHLQKLKGLCDSLIKEKKPSIEQTPYWRAPSKTQYSSWVSLDYGHPYLEYAIIRDHDFPLVEKKGVKKALEIAHDERLAETTNIVFFPDNVLGVTYNQFSPKVWSLPAYLQSKVTGPLTGLHEKVEFLNSTTMEFPSTRKRLERLAGAG